MKKSEYPGGYLYAAGTGQEFFVDNTASIRYAETVGEWWAHVTNKGLVASLWAYNQPLDEVCAVVNAYVTQGGPGGSNAWVKGGTISNCASEPVVSPGCTVNPSTINIQMVALHGEEAETSVSGVNIHCDRAATVRISVGAWEEIPLDGVAKGAAVILDWGEGYGRSASLDVPGKNPTPVELRAKTRGAALFAEGAVLRGSAVVSVSYE
ncbi:hypothetical protein [Serratia plymuthica]|uniref:hypothetical protein n=1 Tax=Serratia plymuthica TaxID=82996 RepID=UPI001419E94E|nr:hypothetical protein [Serratia plymuthica]NIC24890.1 hypothetical protein [Serratia plymuthica]